MLTEQQVNYAKVCHLLGLLNDEMTPCDCYMLAGKILNVCDRERCEEVFALQEQKKAEGDEEFYLWNIPLLEFLETATPEYLAEVRRRIGH